MNKLYAIPLMLLICGFNYRVHNVVTVKLADPVGQMKTLHADAGYKVIVTKNLIIGHATKFYTKKTRASTEFALDISSKKEQAAKYIIKISAKKILICDASSKVLNALLITKHWVDKSGPSNVYDLKDKNGVEYAFDHYVDSNNKNFLAFRFKDSLYTYTDE